MTRTLVCASLTVAALALVAPRAEAQLLLDATFESSQGYVLGPLAPTNPGQQGWQALGEGTDLTATVTTAQAFAGTRSVEVDANQVIAGGWWWTNTPFDTATQANKVIRVTWAQRLSAPAGTPSFSNSSQFGILAYDDEDSLLTGLVLDNYDRSIFTFDPVFEDWTTLSATAVRDQWMRLGFAMNLASRSVRFEVNGVTQPEVQSLLGTRTALAHADLTCRFATTDRSYFDQLRIEAFPVGAIEGVATLLDYTGSLTQRRAILQIRQPGSTTLAAPERSVALDAQGRFVFASPVAGSYDLAIRSETTLTRVLANVTLVDTGVYGVSAALINGDIDGDNAVTVFDYDVLSAYFDRTSSDADWATPGGNGIAPRFADLDGDNAVTVFDYDILSQNFDLVGE